VVVLLVVVIACVLAYVIMVVDNDDVEMDSEVACFINYCILF
jgi:hypothetical protein